MKKLFLCAAVAVLGLTSVNAQDGGTMGFNQGDLFLSGGVGFDSSTTGDAKSNGLTFSPSIGYFVSNNIALELQLLVGSTTAPNDDKTAQFGAGLGATYFFTPVNQFSFTVAAGFAYLTDTDKPDVGDESKVNTFVFSIAPGLNYFVSNHFALRTSIAALSYSSSKADVSGAEATNDLGVNIDLSNINFGVTYKF